MDRLKDKVAIITGAASGMGLAAVKVFAEQGAKIVATDIDYDQLRSKTEAISGEILTVQLDVTSEDQWAHAVSEAEKAFTKIDILVNNAGVSSHRTMLDETLEGWNRALSLNLSSVFLGMRAVVPHMQKQSGGSIINCVSLAAIIGSADNGAVAYAAAKGGVRALTKHAAVNYAKDGIRVNSIYPGAIFTGAAERHGVPSKEVLGQAFKNIIPLPPHAGDAKDIANAYLYLASDESSFVTGEELIIDGGWSSH